MRAGLLLAGLLALGACGKAPGFDERYAHHAAAIESSANGMEADLARRIEAANEAQGIEQAPAGETNRE